LCEDLFFNQLRDAYQSATNRERCFQILTLSPLSLHETMNFFQTTNYMVKLSRKIGAENGLLPEVPVLSKGKVISEELNSRLGQIW